MMARLKKCVHVVATLVIATYGVTAALCFLGILVLAFSQISAGGRPAEVRGSTHFVEAHGRRTAVTEATYDRLLWLESAWHMLLRLCIYGFPLMLAAVMYLRGIRATGDALVAGVVGKAAMLPAPEAPAANPTSQPNPGLSADLGYTNLPLGQSLDVQTAPGVLRLQLSPIPLRRTPTSAWVGLTVLGFLLAVSISSSLWLFIALWLAVGTLAAIASAAAPQDWRVRPPVPVAVTITDSTVAWQRECIGAKYRAYPRTEIRSFEVSEQSAVSFRRPTARMVVAHLVSGQRLVICQHIDAGLAAEACRVLNAALDVKQERH